MPTNRASGSAEEGKVAASALTGYISAAKHIVVPPPSHMGWLNARFSSFANTIQTRLNSSNGTTGGLGGTLEAQVDSALSQVLRQPETETAPPRRWRRARGYQHRIAMVVAQAAFSRPCLPYQASLLREARIIQADFLSILDSLQPLSPFTDPGRRGLPPGAGTRGGQRLLEEFSYARLLPRKQRVRVFLGGLLGWNYDDYPPRPPFDLTAPAWGHSGSGGPAQPGQPGDSYAFDRRSARQPAGAGYRWRAAATLSGEISGPSRSAEPLPLLGPACNLVAVGIRAGGAVISQVWAGSAPCCPRPGRWPDPSAPVRPGSPQLPLQAPWRVGVIKGGPRSSPQQPLLTRKRSSRPTFCCR